MLSSVSQIKSEGNLPETINDRVLEPHLIKAVIEVKKILTEEKYAEIEALNHDDERHLACTSAEANLALSYVLPSLNIETQGSGIVKIKGWDQSRSELVDHTELVKLQQYYRDVAMNLLKPFIPVNESSDEVRGADYMLSSL